MALYRKPKYGKKPGKFKSFLWLLLLIFIFSIGLLICFGTLDQSKTGIDKALSLFSASAKEIRKVTHGIDVARYQGTIDWEQVAESDVDFAMVRLGYRTQVDGEIVEDGNARYNLQQASKHGIHLGAYFFSSAITPEEAREEAVWVGNLLAQYPITYPVAYNCEGFLDPENRQHGLTKEQRTEIAMTFLKSIEDFGYEGMFYASKNEMEEDVHWIASEIQKDYKIWVAQYPDRPYPETGESTYSGPHQMWQFTTLGDIPGIEQNVDCDLAYFGYTKAKKPKDSTPPEEAEPDAEALMDFQTVHEEVTAKEETNLRSLPSQGVESQVLYTLQHGEVATRVGISGTGWSKLEFQGETCYAVSNFLTDDIHGTGASSSAATALQDDGDEFDTYFESVPEEEVTAKDKVNLRTIPSVTDKESKVIGQLKNGQKAIRTGISSNGWSRLQYQDQTCYAVSSYLVGSSGPEDTITSTGEIQTKFEDMNDQVTAKDKVNLRTRPTVQEGGSEVKGQLKAGEVIPRTGINRDLGWSRVIYQGEELYCITNYLKEVPKN